MCDILFASLPLYIETKLADIPSNYLQRCKKSYSYLSIIKKDPVSKLVFFYQAKYADCNHIDRSAVIISCCYISITRIKR